VVIILLVIAAVSPISIALPWSNNKDHPCMSSSFMMLSMVVKQAAVATNATLLPWMSHYYLRIPLRMAKLQPRENSSFPSSSKLDNAVFPSKTPPVAQKKHSTVSVNTKTFCITAG
jgi:hypothetical protein